MDWSQSEPRHPFTLMLSIRVDGLDTLDLHADHQDRWLQRARHFSSTPSSSHTGLRRLNGPDIKASAQSRTLPAPLERWVDVALLLLESLPP